MSIHPALLVLADGRFPAGGHTNSAGVEAAVRCGDVVDAASLARFLRGRLGTTGITDAAFAARACADASLGSPRLLDVLDAEYEARVLSPRLSSVSRTLGRQLARSARAVWPHPANDAAAAVPGGCHQAIAVGLATAAAGGDPADAAALALHHLAAAVTTGAVRLLGLDPVEVTIVQAHSTQAVDELVTDVGVWAVADPADLPAWGGSLAEILAEAHGRWDDRLFVA